MLSLVSLSMAARVAKELGSAPAHVWVEMGCVGRGCVPRVAMGCVGWGRVQGWTTVHGGSV